MLIDFETIQYILTGNKSKSKVAMDMLKIFGIKLTDSERKNFQNILCEKHQPSKTTETIIKNIFLNFIGAISKECKNNFENILKETDDFSESFVKNELSTFEGGLRYFKRDYDMAFFHENYKETLLKYEIENIFLTLEGAIPLIKKKASEDEFKDYLKKTEPLSFIDIQDDVHIQLNSGGRIFSLDVMLYLLACIELDLYKLENKPVKIKNKAIIQIILETILEDSNMPELKPAFTYYTDLWKIFAKEIHNENISFNNIGKFLKIDERNFNFYREINQPRAISKKDLKSILINEPVLLFPIVLFLRNFIKIFINKDIEIGRKIEKTLNKYPRYYELATLRFKEFQTVLEKQG